MALADRSSIEWTEATWNPVAGGDQVSPGCAHCYAKTFAERWRRPRVIFGRQLSEFEGRSSTRSLTLKLRLNLRPILRPGSIRRERHAPPTSDGCPRRQ